MDGKLAHPPERRKCEFQLKDSSAVRSRITVQGSQSDRLKAGIAGLLIAPRLPRAAPVFVLIWPADQSIFPVPQPSYARFDLRDVRSSLHESNPRESAVRTTSAAAGRHWTARAGVSVGKLTTSPIDGYPGAEEANTTGKCENVTRLRTTHDAPFQRLPVVRNPRWRLLGPLGTALQGLQLSLEVLHLPQ